jgi:AraC-like DNA-binding protein
VRRAADADELFRGPPGAYVVGRAFVVFCADADLWGYVMWGALAEADIRAITSSVFHPGWSSVAPHRSLVDLRDVTAIDPSAFTALRETQTAHREQLAHRITHMVIVRPDGLIGAIAEGIGNVVSFPHPVEVVATLDAACTRFRAPELRTELEALRTAREADARVVAELHALLSTQPPALALPEAAKRLGVSSRSLQRRLRDAGTTYLAERNIAQVHRAQQMMRETDATLSQIALDVGCRSLQHFSTLFRRVTGETPSQWRTIHRSR